MKIGEAPIRDCPNVGVMGSKSPPIALAGLSDSTVNQPCMGNGR
jgi:hypothetical protein